MKEHRIRNSKEVMEEAGNWKEIEDIIKILDALYEEMKKFIQEEIKPKDLDKVVDVLVSMLALSKPPGRTQNASPILLKNPKKSK